MKLVTQKLVKNGVFQNSAEIPTETLQNNINIVRLVQCHFNDSE